MKINRQSETTHHGKNAEQFTKTAQQKNHRQLVFTLVSQANIYER